MVDTTDKEGLKQQIFSNVGDDEVSHELVSSATRKVLLNTKDVKLWLEHLVEVVRNCKRGAAKVAAIRQRKKQVRSSTKQATSTTKQPVREEGYYATCGVDYYSGTGDSSSGLLVTSVSSATVLHVSLLKNPQPRPTYVQAVVHCQLHITTVFMM